MIMQDNMGDSNYDGLDSDSDGLDSDDDGLNSDDDSLDSDKRVTSQAFGQLLPLAVQRIQMLR